MTQSKAKLVGWLAPVLVALLTIAAFFPVLQNGFVDWDDDVNIVDNLDYRGLGWQQLRWMFTNFNLGHYQPLSWVTLGLDYVLWGMNPFGYHLTNLILHGANAAIFYFVALRLLSAVFRKSMDSGELPLRVAAGFAALLFALHPLRVESVAWVTERRGLLAGLFFLLSVLCYLRANAIQESSGTRLRWMAAAVTTYGLSLLSKASGLAFPIVLLALDVYPLGRLSGGLKEWRNASNRKLWWEKIPFLVLALTAAALALMAEHQRGAVRSLQEYGIIFRVGQAFFGLTFYPWKTLVPSGLFPMYAVVADAVPASWSLQPPEDAILALSIIMALAVSIVLFLLRHRWPAGLAGWVCYVGLVAPVTGIVRVGGHIVADRYSYLPCLGWAILVGGGLLVLWQRWLSHSRMASASVLVVTTMAVAGLGGLTWRQAQVWHDSDTLFGHVLAVSPRSKMAHVNFGFVLASRGEFDKAVKHYQQALQIDPDYPIAHFDLADSLSQQGKADEAVKHYRHVIRLRPGFVMTYHNLGMLLVKQGKLEEAADSYRRALEIAPTFEEAHNNLGYILAGRGKVEEAIEHYRKALDLNPEYALAHVNFGDALVLRGKLDEAIVHFRKALESEPGLARAHYSLGRVLAEQGQLSEAIKEYGEAVKSDGSLAVAYYDMGNAYFELGKYKEAVEQYGRAVKIDPSYAVAYYNMGNALLKVGDIGGAIERYRMAIKYDSGYAEAHSNLGSALERRGEVEEAVGQYRKALEIDPGYGAAHFNLGLLLGERGDIQGAIEHFRQVVQIDPRDAEARYHLGRLLAVMGQVEQAAGEFKEALKIRPGFAEARESLNQLLAQPSQRDAEIQR